MFHHRSSYRISSNLPYIVLEVLPLGICVSVHLLIAQTARSLLAGLEAGVTVEAEEEALGVDILSEGSHAGGEFLPVLDDFSSSFVAGDLPAVIEIEVFKTLSGEAGTHELVCGLTYEGLVDIAAKAVPGIPAHWWGLTETVVQCIAEDKQE